MPRRDSTASPFLLSLVLHGLAFAVIVTGVMAPDGRSDAAAALLQPPQTMTFRLVDTPEGLEAEPDRLTDLVSERDTRAADRGPSDLPEGAAFSRGRTSLPNPTPGEGGRAAGSAEPPPASGGDPGTRSAPPRGAGERRAATGEIADVAGSADRRATPRLTPLGDSRLELPRRETRPTPRRPPGLGGRPGLPQVDSRLSRASYRGDFSLSTYAWDYAPYMRRLKAQIEEYTWTILPSAFWYGIAAWATQVRFVILPDGSVESIAITGHDGVLELRHVAPDAVTGAARFEPLPPGFPDEELTVTGNFYFNVFPPGDGAEEEGGSP
ncbi:MAG: hypothetical protein ABR599_11470 [Gemmatimonadota bacterium]